MKNPVLIAGKSAGHPVKCNSDIAGIFSELERLSRDKKNYWALRAVQELKSLTAGHDKPNVFVSSEVAGASRREIMMVLPGCVARIVKTSKGEYLIYGLEADTAYDRLQRKGERPGLYRADFENFKWKASHDSSDSVLDKPYRMVAIADRRESPDEAAGESADFLIESPISTGGKVIKNEGFDLHFTPGGKVIGGWINIRQAMNAERDPELRESAVQLAYTMAKSRKTKSVSWVSVQGGSGVLTQAMRILKDNGVSFKGSDHSVFFSRLTTLSVPAERLARDIGLEFDRETKSHRWSPSEFIGGTGFGVGNIAAAWNRYRGDTNHTTLKFGVDVSREVSGLVGGTKRLGDAAIAGGIALGVISATGAAASAFPPAVAFALAAGGAAVRSGPAAIEALFPHFYNKMKKKL